MTSKTIEHRWYRHQRTAKYGSNTYLHRAIRKYGAESFLVEYVCDGSAKEEISTIATLKPTYNMTKGGDGGNTSTSPNYRSFIATVNRQGANNHMYGKKGSSNPNYGKKRTDEQRQKAGLSNYIMAKRCPVTVKGEYFPSISAAARHFKRSDHWVKLNCERIKNYA